MNASMPSERIAYFDLLRSMAIMGVVVVHSAGDVFARSAYSAHNWMISAFFVGIGYWAVPIFLMISGALILGKDDSIHLGRHYKKTLLRLVVPFLVWSALYPVFYSVTGIRQVPIDAAVRMVFLTDRSTAPHLWFSYVIIGLYLIAPILGKAINYLDDHPRAGRIGWACFAAFFVAMVLGNDLSAVANVQIPVVSLIPTKTIYLGYFMAGFLLHRWGRMGTEGLRWMLVCAAIASMAYLVGYSLKLYGMGMPLAERNVLFTYWSVPLVVISLSVFLAVKWWANTGLKGAWFLSEASANAYGIYFCHMLFIKAFQKWPSLEGFRQLDASQWILIPLKAGIVFLLSFVLAGALRRIPRIGRLFA